MSSASRNWTSKLRQWWGGDFFFSPKRCPRGRPTASELFPLENTATVQGKEISIVLGWKLRFEGTKEWKRKVPDVWHFHDCFFKTLLTFSSTHVWSCEGATEDLYPEHLWYQPGLTSVQRLHWGGNIFLLAPGLLGWSQPTKVSMTVSPEKTGRRSINPQLETSKTKSAYSCHTGI